MSQYFDTDFFKFLLSFVAIILLSCVIIIGMKMYQSNAEMSPTIITNE